MINYQNLFCFNTSPPSAATACVRVIAIRTIIARDVYTYMGFDGLIRIMSSGQANETWWKTDNGNPVQWLQSGGTARAFLTPTRAPVMLDKMVFHCCAYRMYSR